MPSACVVTDYGPPNVLEWKDVPLPEPFHPAWAPGVVETRIRVAYVRIDTDAGVHGIAGHEFYGAEEQAVARVATYLLGEDPLRIEQHAGVE